LLKFAAKVALDKLIGVARTDEFVREFLTRNPEELKRELAAAKRESTDVVSVESAIDDAAADAGVRLDDEQRDAAAMSVVTGFADLPDAGGGDVNSTVAVLADDFGSGKAKKFLVWLTHPILVEPGPGHYCHFYWKKGESFRIRDYITGHIYKPPAASITNAEWEEEWVAIDIDLPAARVWEACRKPVKCEGDLGTILAVPNGYRWREILRLASEVAKQWGAPG
jgi:hypothetical protein